MNDTPDIMEFNHEKLYQCISSSFFLIVSEFSFRNKYSIVHSIVSVENALRTLPTVFIQILNSHLVIISFVLHGKKKKKWFLFAYVVCICIGLGYIFTLQILCIYQCTCTSIYIKRKREKQL